MNPLMASVRRVLAQPSFVAAAIVLALAALTLNTAVSRLQLHFKKVPVALARDLDTLPAKLGDWVQLSHDEPLDRETQDVLGTDKYIFRDYVNTKVCPPALLAQINATKTAIDRKNAITQFQVQNPEAVVNLAVTYYTGMVDTVAHIPDRCYIADGYEPSEYEEPYWDLGPSPLGRAKGADPRIQVRFINFEDQTGVAKLPKSVCYFFHVNGQYESSPIGVRVRLQDLTSKYGYYAKVELMTLLRDRQKSAEVMCDFLRSARPEIEKLLPDWERVTHAAVN